MKQFRISLLAAAIAVSFASKGMAQDLQYGIIAGGNIPLGDLGSAVDHRLGLTVGGQLGIYYGNGHELRPRVDYTYYQGGWAPVGDSFSRNTISNLGLGADYVYYTEQRQQGVFLAMGLGYQWWNVSPEHGSSTNQSGVSVAAGGGYRFNRTFSLEGRFVTGQFQSTNGQANAIQILGIMRF
ncbi:MAG TPA: hypothetical protein PKL14_07820 [Holophaga sp.]|nr:hypothetical protein [Holophaga sp.]